MTIVFVSPCPTKPTGGVKVIYQFCEELNNIGCDAEIMHTDNLESKCDWLSHEARFRRVATVNPCTDFLIIPEGGAGALGKQCLSLGVRYAIFVQNGYQTYNDSIQSTCEELDAVYNSSSFIIVVSENTRQVIKFLHPLIPDNRILILTPYVSSNFSYDINNIKKKIITYMPRKLGLHAIILTYFLKKKLPSDWAFLQIDNMNEIEVSDAFKSSSIFLSFSEMEGLGLPPIEAAICGNIVVGYHGEGGSSYFFNPLFREVYPGNFLDYVNKVLYAIVEIENGVMHSNTILNQIQSLRTAYSIESFRESVSLIANKIKSEL